MRVIEAHSVRWGGRYFMMVPVSRDGIQAEQWALLEKYDPDIVAAYGWSAQDLSACEPERYAGLKQQREQELQKLAPDQCSEWVAREAERLINDSLQEQDVYRLVAPDLLRRLACFGENDRPAHAHVDGSPPDPGSVCTPLHDVMRAARLDQVALPIMSTAELPALLRLAVFAATGALSADAQKTLHEMDVRAEGRDVDESGATYLAVYPHEWLRQDRRHHLLPAGDVPDEITFLSAFSPFSIGMSELQVVVSSPVSRLHDALVVVVGEDLRDFALYYNLSRLRPGVFWLPPSLCTPSTGVASRYSRHLSATTRETTRAKLDVLSASLKQDTALAAAEKMTKPVVASGTPKLAWRSLADVGALVPGVQRVYNTDNASNEALLALRGRCTIGTVPTPRLKGIETKSDKFGWISEVRVRNYALPAAPGLVRQVVQDPRLDSDSRRISREGLVYHAISPIRPVGQPTPFILVRPHLRLPSPLEVFQAIYGEAGYDVTLSDKGHYLDQTLQRFGRLQGDELKPPTLDVQGAGLPTGLRRFAAFLRRPEAVLLRLMGRKKKENEQHPLDRVGKDCAYVSQRWRVTLAGAAKAIGSDGSEEGPLAQMLDSLVAAHILGRGLVLRCSECRNTDWYPIERAAGSFTCTRCSATRRFGRQHFFPEEAREPTWYYSLSEVVYQALSNNSDVTAMAMDWLNRKAEKSFIFTAELELIRRGQEISSVNADIDVNCVVDGEIIVGEAKSGWRLPEQDLKLLRAISDAFPIRRVCFCTATHSWQRNEQHIKDAFRQSLTEPILLTKDELFKPP
jgi:hypothetical protein